MPRISIRQNTELSVSIDPREVSNLSNKGEYTSFRFSLANVKFPEQDVLETLPESIPVGAGYLGDIDFNIVAKFNQFEEVGDFNFTVKNKSLVEQRTINYPTTFRPCDLDVDGDGFITNEDIDTIFSRPKIPRKFDINGDGVVNDTDRNLAREYVGTICNTVGDPDIGNEYYGVYDYLDMAFGYSLNRLLKGSHSNKPLFRVGMIVNNFSLTADQIADPDLFATSQAWVYMDRNQQGVYAQSPVLMNFHTSMTLDGDPEGKIIYQDIFWKGSEDKIREDLLIFYSYGKELQEANGIPTEWDYYNTYRSRYIFNTAKVMILYDQSGNGNNALMRQRSNDAGQQSFPANYCSFHQAPIIVSKGEVTVNENGKIAFSQDGSHAGDIEGLGRDEAGVNATSLDFSEAGQPLYAPSTNPFGSACVYTVKSIIGPSYSNPGLGESYDVIDLFEYMAQNYGFDSFSDIFLGDGTMDPNFNPYVGSEGQSPGADRSDIYSAIQGYALSPLFGSTTPFRLYHQTNGQHIDWFHPYVVLTGVSNSNIIEYEDYVGGYAPLKDQMQSGAKSFYLRMAYPNDVFSNYNQACGHKKMREGAVCAMTIATLPEIDFRINNDQIVSGINLNTPHGRYQPSVLPYNTQRESFSEMAGFNIQNNDEYGFIAEEVNEYYQTTPFETAFNPPL